MNYEHPKQNHGALRISYPETFSPSNILLLEVDASSVDTSPVENYAAQEGFEPKDEYHLTVIGFSVGNKLKKSLKHLSSEQQETAMGELNHAIGLLGATTLKSDRYHRISKTYNYGEEAETRESIIQEVDIEGVEEFYSVYSQITGQELGTPFPHLTLYTKGDGEDSYRGIGIPSVEALDTISHQQIEV